MIKREAFAVGTRLIAPLQQMLLYKKINVKRSLRLRLCVNKPLACTPKLEGRRIACTPKLEERRIACAPKLEERRIACTPKLAERRIACTPKLEERRSTCTPKLTKRRRTCAIWLEYGEEDFCIFSGSWGGVGINKLVAIFQMKTTKSIVIVLLVALLPVNLKSSCLCSKNMVTFLPYANRSKDGIVALVKIVRQNVFDQGPYEDLPFLDPFPINYLEVKVLKNLGSNKLGDTINILMPGEVECCLLYPRIGIQGDTAVIHAFEWNESDYGYNNNEFKAFCLTTCMVSSLSVKNGFVIGPITRKKEQRIPIDQFIRKF